MFGRVTLAPILAMIVISIAGLFIEMNSLFKKVFAITILLPTMSNIAIVAKEYKKDYEFSVLMVVYRQFYV